jgi:hypothetical protein
VEIVGKWARLYYTGKGTWTTVFWRVVFAAWKTVVVENREET